MVRAKIVLKDFTVSESLLSLVNIEGKKTALAKAEQLKAALVSVSNGNNAILDIFKEKTQALLGFWVYSVQV